jgi:hypothetical protein
VSLVIHVRGIREVLDPRGTIQAVRDPHDTEGVRCTLARFHRSCMGLFSGLLHPGLSVKSNKDNECLFNDNIMNELMYDHVCYNNDYDSMHDYANEQEHEMLVDKYKLCIEQEKNVILMMVLGSP